mmetsp:Transcript_17480/g.37786  ORF Transcript_17480/g.37786 Transcript_17480/m.37786 type:complete len:282 (+) Transcript_17480:1-846(+)
MTMTMAPPSATAERDAAESDTTATKNDGSPTIISSPKEINKQITKGVVRAKLSKRRHLVLPAAISPTYLDTLMPSIVTHLFEPQTVTYNGGVANITKWKISCYLEVMGGGIPCTNPHEELKHHCWELLETCNALFQRWYRQQHACNDASTSKYKTDENGNPIVSRLMTFITRYTPAPDENALLKHVDGAGKVDGSIVIALPIDRWTASHEQNSFEGHGGGLTFWDGRMQKNPISGQRRVEEILYDTRSGDLAFIDRAVWHQANPITKGTRWALVIFYKVER